MRMAQIERVIYNSGCLLHIGNLAVGWLNRSCAKWACSDWTDTLDFLPWQQMMIVAKVE